MAILGLGTDIVEIARIEAVIARSGERLARRVLSDNEWAIWKTHHQPVRFLAKVPTYQLTMSRLLLVFQASSSSSPKLWLSSYHRFTTSPTRFLAIYTPSWTV